MWNALNTIASGKFKCGYCGENISSDKGYSNNLKMAIPKGSNIKEHGYIYICHSCDNPTYIDNFGDQYPGASFGNEVEHIKSEEVEKLYNESRDCMKVNAFTASVMCSRKILMNIAVDKGAEVAKKYAEYVEYLASKGYVPPDSKEWVDSIRAKGNEANHEIRMMSKDDAEQLIKFVEMILKFIYEFPESFKGTSSGNNESTN